MILLNKYPNADTNLNIFFQIYCVTSLNQEINILNNFKKTKNYHIIDFAHITYFNRRQAF